MSFPKIPILLSWLCVESLVMERITFGMRKDQHRHKNETMLIASSYFVGVHYWYNNRVDMSCSEFFPVFLMYNNGTLNSFGWAFGINLQESPRFEHPPPPVYPVGFQITLIVKGRVGILKALLGSA